MSANDQNETTAYSGEVRLRTSDPDEFTELFSVISPGASASAHDAQSFKLRMRGHLLSHVRIFMARLEHTRILRPPEDYIGLTIPLDGGFQIAERQSPEEYTPGSAHILREDREFDLRAPEATTVLVANVNARVLDSHGSRLLGADSGEASIRKHGALSLDTAEGRSLWLALSSVWRDLSQPEACWHSPLVAEEFEDRIMTKLCLAYSGRGARDEGRSRPQYLERAVDYLMANLSEPVSLADLTEASAVSAPTLIRAFRERYQTTPIAFLRERRLDAVHRILLAAEPEEGLVTQTALNFGFGHLGRFAGQYFRAFGERPSETLRARSGLGAQPR